VRLGTVSGSTKGSMVMLRKCVRISFLFVAVVLAVNLTAAVGEGNPIVRVTAHSVQIPIRSPNIFGLTVSDIYDRGVIVTDVDLGSPARKVGIQKNDVILEVNGIPVLSADDFQRLVQEFAGWPIAVRVSRLGRIDTVIIDGR
jgi:S1-C subfamily serine protease